MGALVVGIVAGIVGVPGCGGGSQVAVSAPPPPQTSGPLVGPLCDFGGCKCRTGDADAGEPAGQYKRFEVVLGPTPYAEWLTLPGRVLYKSAQTPKACFYVDIAPGVHPAQLFASHEGGTVAVAEIHELGTRTGSWYDTFRFSCGYGGACSLDELDEIKATYARVSRNLHDPCGTTKIKGIGWDHGRVPDTTHPTDLVVHFTLDLYKFDAWREHGDPSCTEKGGPPPAGYGNDGTGPAPAAPVDEPTAPAPATP